MTTTRADQPESLSLFIYNRVATDSAAATAARRLVKTLPSNSRIHIQLQTSSTTSATSDNGIVLAPLSWWNQKIPAINVVRLPFFFADLGQVHSAIDGKLGQMLAQQAQLSGWKLLAIWDAGMTDFTGLQSYNRLPNLSGMQFAMWEKDPLVAMELRALDVWSSVIKHRGVQRLAQECLVNSRATTPTQMLREHLQRVHLDITLTQDRYKGYLLAIPESRWQKLTATQRELLKRTLNEVTAWERHQAARQQAQALKQLHKAGMRLHPLNETQRRLFASRMPHWKQFLSGVDTKTAEKLIAAARAATAATRSSRGTHEKALANSLPAAHATE